MAAPRFSAAPTRGFTLIELLVAISIMALMAILGWRGLDGMSRAQVATQARADDVLTLQAALGQWSADLDAIVQIPQTQALDWDGRALRITRRSSQPNDPGPLVVAWTRRATGGSSGVWLRWQSAPVRSQNAWAAAWEAAARWGQSGGTAEAGAGQAVRIAAALDWQLHYFRNNAWTNPLSSGAASGIETHTLPDGVRLFITLAPGQALAGPLIVDWVRPDFGGAQ